MMGHRRGFDPFHNKQDDARELSQCVRDGNPLLAPTIAPESFIVIKNRSLFLVACERGRTTIPVRTPSADDNL
jgi:hypothetical protein